MAMKKVILALLFVAFVSTSSYASDFHKIDSFEVETATEDRLSYEVVCIDGYEFVSVSNNFRSVSIVQVLRNSRFSYLTPKKCNKENKSDN